MVTDLTGMEVANASLLDEATAAAEAMALLLRVRKPAPAGGAPVLLVADTCFPQTIAVLQARAEPLGIDVRVGPLDGMSLRRRRLRRPACSARTQRGADRPARRSSRARTRPAPAWPSAPTCWR